MLTALICKYNGRWLRGQPRGRVDGRNSGAAAEAPGLQMVSVTTTGGGDDALRGVVPSAPLLHRDDGPMEVDAPPEAEPRPLSISRLQGRWFQRFCAWAETEGATSFSLGRLGVFQHRGSNGDGFPGGAAASAGTVRARCLVQTSTRWTTPSSTESSRDSFVDIFLATVSVAVPETASLIYSRDSSSDSSTESSRDSFLIYSRDSSSDSFTESSRDSFVDVF